MANEPRSNFHSARLLALRAPMDFMCRHRAEGHRDSDPLEIKFASDSLRRLCNIISKLIFLFSPGRVHSES